MSFRIFTDICYYLPDQDEKLSHRIFFFNITITSIGLVLVCIVRLCKDCVGRYLKTIFLYLQTISYIADNMYAVAHNHIEFLSCIFMPDVHLEGNYARLDNPTSSCKITGLVYFDLVF